MRRRVLTLCAVLTLLAPALGSARSTRLAPADPAAALQAADRQVGIIGATLAGAAHTLCRRRVGAIGVVLDDLARYAPVWQATAARSLGSATVPVIVAVVPGTGAERAGLLVGDAILGVDGWRTPAPAASGDRVEAVLDRIEATAPPQAVMLHLRRDGRALDVPVRSQAACATRFQVRSDTALSAEANGSRVEISSAMVQFARGRDELAAILAHELAHNVLDHRARLAAAGVPAACPGGPRAASLVIATEMEADRLAVYLMDRAGYDPAAFQTLWRRLGRGGDAVHPPNARRRALVAAEVRRIGAARQRGRVPWPDDLAPYLAPR